MRTLLTLAGVSLALIATPSLAQDFDPMMMADSDQNGTVSLEEFTAFSNMGWSFFSNGADKLKVADLDPGMKGQFTGVPVDADGYVTQAAWEAAIPARFKAADKNNDGVLDSAELKASMAPPAN